MNTHEVIIRQPTKFGWPIFWSLVGFCALAVWLMGCAFVVETKKNYKIIGWPPTTQRLNHQLRHGLGFQRCIGAASRSEVTEKDYRFLVSGCVDLEEMRSQ